jgi:hypothetical protein
VVNADTETFVWIVRNAVYAMIVETGRAPDDEAVASRLDARPDRVRAAYERLDARHALFLTPGTHDIRMAHPFSGVATDFRVEVGGRGYWANCAWDALGIPAALHADARVDAKTGDDGAPVRFVVEDGRVSGWDGVIQFSIPFRHWYDGLIRT